MTNKPTHTQAEITERPWLLAKEKHLYGCGYRMWGLTQPCSCEALSAIAEGEEVRP